MMNVMPRRISGSVITSALSLAIVAALLPGIASAQVFDETPHVLVTVGHTNSAEWDGSLGKYVPTCDYKRLNGSVPRRGEACDGSPRISFSVEDLQSLRYITQASDHMEFVRRVYERFPKILFISSPDAAFNYDNSPELRTAQTVNFREVLPQGVSVRDYDFLANKAVEFLRKGTSGVYSGRDIMAKVLGPYSNDLTIGGTLEDTSRVLPEYTLAFFYNNPFRATLTHELIHFLIDRAQERAISKPARLVELGQNQGKLSYLSNLFKEISEVDYEPKLVAHWDMMLLEYALENKALAIPEELEVAYFISKYGAQLNLIPDAIASHRDDFWKYVEAYSKSLNEAFHNTVKGIVPNSIVEPVNSNASFEIDGQVIPGYFRDYWARILTIAAAYPTNLLGDEHNVNRRNPRTIIDHFVVDVGPRNSTTASR